LIDHGFQLRVQRHVAIVVEFADRDPQPVGRSDLDYSVGGEAEEFTFAHPGPGEQFDREPAELVGELPRRCHELSVRGVVEKPGQWFVFDGHVGGVDRWPGGCVGVVPLDDPPEERTEVAHPHPDRRLGDLGVLPVATPRGQPGLVGLDVHSVDIGNGGHFAGRDKVAGDLPEGGLDACDRRRPQTDGELVEVAAHGRRHHRCCGGDLVPTDLGHRPHRPGLPRRRSWRLAAVEHHCI
jgi:hypothetical protein